MRIDTTMINEYVEGRLNDKLASGTINREPAALKRMFKLFANHTPPKVCPNGGMTISGNATRSVFDRHDILTEGDLDMAREARSLHQIPAGQDLGKVAEFKARAISAKSIPDRARL